VDVRCCKAGSGIRVVRPKGVETLRECAELTHIEGKEETQYQVIDGMHRVTALLEAKGKLGYIYSARIYRKDTPDSVIVAFANGN